jgi:hypothetical protein
MADTYAKWLSAAFVLMMVLGALAMVIRDDQTAVAVWLVTLTWIGLYMIFKMELFTATCILLLWVGTAMLAYGPVMSFISTIVVLLGLIGLIAGAILLYEWRSRRLVN